MPNSGLGFVLWPSHRLALLAQIDSILSHTHQQKPVHYSFLSLTSTHSRKNSYRISSAQNDLYFWKDDVKTFLYFPKTHNNPPGPKINITINIMSYNKIPEIMPGLEVRN